MGGSSCQWHSPRDTETIIALTRDGVQACVERFHGMFAFAIWDRLNPTMFAARDRMGAKPFYYHHSSDCFAFASRPRALLRLSPQLGRLARRSSSAVLYGRRLHSGALLDLQTDS